MAVARRTPSRRAPYNSQSLVFPPVRRTTAVSNGPTIIQYFPNPSGIRDFAQALTLQYMGRSYLSNSPNSHIYDDFYLTICEVIKSAFRQDPVPPFHPLPWHLAVVFHMFNTVKMSHALAGGARFQFSIADWDFLILSPSCPLAEVGNATDPNGFSLIPNYNPGSADERRETWNLIIGSDHKQRVWNIGDPLPSYCDGVSQFGTVRTTTTGGLRSFTGHNAVLESFVPAEFPVLGALNLVSAVTDTNGQNLTGLHKTHLYGTPQLYCGMFVMQNSPNLRRLVDLTTFRMEDFVCLCVGVMEGVNRQSAIDGDPLVFENIDPVYFYAHLNALIAISQHELTPMTVDHNDSNIRSIRLGTHFPVQDQNVLGSLLGNELLMEYLRLIRPFMIQVPTGGSMSECLIVPIFAAAPDILSYIARCFAHAGISTAAIPVTDVDVYTWTTTTNGQKISYGRRLNNDPNVLQGWGKYNQDFMAKANRHGIYMPLRSSHPAIDYGYNPVAYFRAFVTTENFLSSVEMAVTRRSTGANDRTLVRLRGYHSLAIDLMSQKRASSKASGDPFKLDEIGVASATYWKYDQSFALFTGLPIGHRPLIMSDPVGVTSDVTRQHPGVAAMTTVSTPLANDPNLGTYLLALSCVGSSRKDTRPNELMQKIHNDLVGVKGNGGAFSSALDGMEELSRALFQTIGKTKDTKRMQRYDSVAKPVRKVVNSVTKPVERIVDKMLK